MKGKKHHPEGLTLTLLRLLTCIKPQPRGKEPPAELRQGLRGLRQRRSDEVINSSRHEADPLHLVSSEAASSQE